MNSGESVSYRHTQRGPWSVLLCASGVLMVILAWSLREQPVAPLALPIGATIMLVLASAFDRLTVVGEADALVLRFGPLPLFRKRIPYSDIQTVVLGRTTLLDGWGIHVSLKGGWVWNIWGMDCVVVRHRGTTRVGTDDGENLAAFLTARILVTAADA